MGDFATKGGLNRALFAAARAWFGHWRGGLALATIGGCAAFGAICGSSLATAATMSQVALPEMRRHGYSPALATGTLAAGGTLGILIPPSVILVIYAIYTEQSIGVLFIAAVIPGILATAGYMLVVNLYARLYPGAAPPAERLPWSARWKPTLEVWPVILVFVLVVTGMYAGWFSATEGAAVGAAATGVLAVDAGRHALAGAEGKPAVHRRDHRADLPHAARRELFSAALALSRVPAELSASVAAMDLPPLVVLFAILLIYFVLGCFMESMAMVLLTLPIFIPLMLALDFGLSQAQVLVWFGILVLVSVEVGMISPPFGLNLFVINSMAKDVPMGETYKGVAGFCASDVVRIILLVFAPVLSLWLPGLW